MPFRSWIHGLFTHTPRTIHKAPARFRPRLDEMEPRLVPSFTLGTGTLLEGPGGGNDSDIVNGTGAWSATANASWLHTTASGTDSGAAIFTFDADAGTTRTGTLTIAGQTLTVTQAGSNYVAAGLTALPISGLDSTTGVATDSAGNLYLADGGDNTIKEWNASTQTLSTIVSSGLNNPGGLAVDSAGNVYIADIGHNAIEEWNVSTQTLGTLVSGLNESQSVAVDGAGNVYFTFGNDVREWKASAQTVSTIISSGLNLPFGVATDNSGNVYVSDPDLSAVVEWSAATQTVNTIIDHVDAPLLQNPDGLGVDNSGNVFIADSTSNTIDEWNAATQTLSAVASGLNQPFDVKVDSSGDAFVIDGTGVEELPRAFVSSALDEVGTAGSDVAQVLPATQSLTGVYAAGSNEPWLTIGSPAAGAVNFSFTANPTGAPRSALITVLGQSIPVRQAPGVFALGTTSLVEGPAAGTASVIVTGPGAWTATANVPWLHTTASGTSDGTAVFSLDANTGATRTGTITIAGLTLTVTQAGSNYAAATGLTKLAFPGMDNPFGMAVDSSGNAYIADDFGSTMNEWNASTQTLSTLVSSGLSGPTGVAVDSAGNLYIADSHANAINVWNASTQTLSTLISTGLNQPQGVAIDSAGNLYIADTGDNAVQEWNAATKTLSTLVSGLSAPTSVALDSADNLYIADSGHNAIKEWNYLTLSVSTVVSGLGNLTGVAVDSSGNLYIADTSLAVKEWNAATQAVSTIATFPTQGDFKVQGVAVDSSGNV